MVKNVKEQIWLSKFKHLFKKSNFNTDLQVICVFICQGFEYDKLVLTLASS